MTIPRTSEAEPESVLPGSAISWACGLLLLAGTTRLFRLTYWPLAGDEFFTIQDSLALNTKGKPLLFYLNHHLIEPWLGLDALGARFLPALFGIISILLVYWAGQRLADHATGAFAALLIVFNPWHLYMSQYARYYTLAFLLAIASMALLYLGYRENNVPRLLLGLAAAGISVLAHPSAGLVFGAVCVWAVADTVRTVFADESVSILRLGIAVGMSVVVAIFGMTRFIPILVGWTQSFGAQGGFSGPVLLLSFGQWMTAGVCLFAAAGAAWLWRSGEKKVVSYLLCVVLLPVLFLLVGGYVFRANVPFLFAAAPPVFLLAGHFLGRLLGILRSRELAPGITVAVVLLVGIATGLPSFVSHYMDGSRPDYRTAADYLDRHAPSEGGVVLSDLSNNLRHYLDAPLEIRGFRRTEDQLEEALAEATGEASTGALWITPWVKDRAGFAESGLGAVTSWVRRRCVLEHVVSRPRLDFRRNAVHVYRCPRPSTAVVTSS